MLRSFLVGRQVVVCRGLVEEVVLFDVWLGVVDGLVVESQEVSALVGGHVLLGSVGVREFDVLDAFGSEGLVCSESGLVVSFYFGDFVAEVEGCDGVGVVDGGGVEADLLGHEFVVPSGEDGEVAAGTVSGSESGVVDAEAWLGFSTHERVRFVRRVAGGTSFLVTLLYANMGAFLHEKDVFSYVRV